VDVIAFPFYPVFRIGDVIIWDFTGLEKADKMELFTRDDILRPKKKDRNNIIFCKCNFNVKSLIHEKVTSDDIYQPGK